jgi:hypothetical protein
VTPDLTGFWILFFAALAVAVIVSWPGGRSND